MARYVVNGVVPGSLAAFVAAPRVLATLHSAARALRIDLTVTDAPTGDVDVRIGDGTADQVVTLAAAATHVSFVPTGLEWPAGTNLEFEIEAAVGGFNLTAQVFIEELGAAQAAAGLVSLSDAKTVLGITGVDATRDAFLQRSIDVISARIRDYCHQHLSVATYRDEWFGPGVVHLRANPVEVLVSVTADGATLDVATGVRFDHETGRLMHAVSTDTLQDWHGYRYLETVYTAGHDPIPADLADLVYVALFGRYNGWLAGSQGLGSQLGVSRVQFPDGGAVTYDTAAAYGSGLLDAPDFLLGFPLSMLDKYRDVAELSAGCSSQLWEFYTP